MKLSFNMSAKSIMFHLNSVFSAQRVLFARQFAVPVHTQCINFSKLSIEEKLGYAVKPKRPLTPYFRYLAQIREELKQENPNIKTMDIAKLAAAKWKQVEPQIRSKLEDEYKKEHQIYLKQKIEYSKTVTEEQKDDMRQYKANLEEQKLKRDLKKQMRELGKPKKPISAFLRFMRSQEDKKGDMKFRDWQLKVSDMWQNLHPNEKEKILNSVKQDMLDYKKQISAWEEKMIRLGHVNMVRHQALIHPPSNRSHFPLSRGKTNA